MKTPIHIQPLARPIAPQKPMATPIDSLALKRQRFKALLDMMSGDRDRPHLQHLGLMATGIKTSPFDRLLQTLQIQLAASRHSSLGADKQASQLSAPQQSANRSRPPDAHFKTTGTASSEKEQIDDSVTRAAAKYDLPATLINGVIRAESNYNPVAVSPAGAQGLMQLMPGTARELGVTDAFSIEQNIDGGAKYLRQMIDRFDGDVSKALAAYNAGPGTVDRYNGKVPYRETIAYVDRVLGFAKMA